LRGGIQIYNARLRIEDDDAVAHTLYHFIPRDGDDVQQTIAKESPRHYQTGQGKTQWGDIEIGEGLRPVR
jgi:hypothetical protein